MRSWLMWWGFWLVANERQDNVMCFWLVANEQLVDAVGLTCGMFLEAMICSSERRALVTASRNSSSFRTSTTHTHTNKERSHTRAAECTTHTSVCGWDVNVCVSVVCLMCVCVCVCVWPRYWPAELNTKLARCWATICRPATPPRGSVSMVARMLWRQVRARHCTRCILGQNNIGMVNRKTSLTWLFTLGVQTCAETAY